ncbi:MAG: peptide-methionine (S)-S-oxide reductase MsrA, partial [Bacteroidota bacterium]|nr:peptide-methionine (S)-S-oxide reductase MsrA [Bacteroidota bacterium]
FIPEKDDTETAYYAGGCFWGVEYFMKSTEGVISIDAGYIGGIEENPNYNMVCSGQTNYAEAVKIIFNPTITTYEDLTKLFFEIHDPTQLNKQGPDVGKQYRSEIFYTNDKQKLIADSLINILKNKELSVVTKVSKATKFYKAEEYHQNYYQYNAAFPYCHAYKKRF